MPTSMRRFALLLAVLPVLTLAPLAHAKLARQGTPTVGFLAIGPAGFSIRGTSHDLTVNDDGARVTAIVPASSLTTGIDLRDEHMRRALESDTYKTIEIALDRAALRFPAEGGETSGDAPAIVTLHGQPRPGTVHYTAARANGTLHIRATTRIDMPAHGVNVPNYHGITVKPNVEIQAEFDANDS